MRVVTVVGARPQFIKAAAVSRVLAARGHDEVLVHTGQHFDDAMARVFFAELELGRPDHDLGIHGGRHGAMTARMLERLEGVLIDEAPDVVLVYGDTNSTLAGALAAAKLGIRLAHVEAGLRSFERSMPEEVNRVVTDHVADVLLCPTSTSVKNLTAEGLGARAHHVGDVMYDVALWAAERARTSQVLQRLGVTPGEYAVATVHRAATTDDPRRLREVVEYLQARDGTTIWPLHPRTGAALQRDGLDVAPVRLVSPLSYIDMARLVSGATCLLTDSGGLQKEAYFHRVPCVTLREETEWVETVTHGWNRLWRTPSYAARRPIEEYGFGRAAERIVDVIADHA